MQFSPYKSEKQWGPRRNGGGKVVGVVPTKFHPNQNGQSLFVKLFLGGWGGWCGLYIPPDMKITQKISAQVRGLEDNFRPFIRSGLDVQVVLIRSRLSALHRGLSVQSSYTGVA